MPIKWTAPEILSGNVAELSTQSDVYVQYVWDIAQLVRSRWLDIGQVLLFFASLWPEMESRSINT